MIGGLSIGKEDVDSLRRAARRWADEALLAARRHWVRLGEPIRPSARAFFVVGCQRSGTSMLARAMSRSPHVDLHNEADTRAFEHFRIRGPQITNRLVRRSRGRIVVFKTICDTQNLPRILLDHNSSRAIWLYRNVHDVARSCVRAWGDHLTHAIRTMLMNREQSGWYGEQVSVARMQHVADLARRPLNPESGAALFWYLRNSLFFDLQLARDPRVRLVKYESILEDPHAGMREMLEFAQLPWCEASTHSVRTPARVPEPAPIDGKIAAACAELMGRLEESRLRAGTDRTRFITLVETDDVASST